MNQINIQYHKTPLADFIIGSYEEKICLLDFKCKQMRETIDEKLQKNFNASFVEQTSPIIEECKKQLDEYLNGKRKVFDFPLSLDGTPFQNKVWNALLKIPYGETRSYKQIAQMIGNEKASRAVGMANNKNKIPIIIPCHRVVGSSGKLVGYAGGLDVKKSLLEIEGIL